MKRGGALKKLLKAMVMVLAFTLVFSLVGCSSKKAITADMFESIMKDENYDVSDGSGDFVDPDYDIKEVRIAGNVETNDNHCAMFYELGSTNDAKDFYKKQVDFSKENIKDEELDVKTTSKSSGDYQKYTVKGDDAYLDESYIVLIRVKNTVLIIYMDGDGSSDVKTADGIISKLGY